jgi:acetamidase/formamidase
MKKKRARESTMKSITRSIFRACTAVLLGLLVTDPAAQAAQQAPNSLTGRWIGEFTSAGMANSDVDYQRLTFEQQGDTLTVRGPGRTMRGTIRGRTVELREPHWAEGERVYRGSVEKDVVKLTTHTPLGDYALRATRDASQSPSARIHEFSPAVFHRQFRGDVAPALRINRGDTVRTWTLDATGKDAHDRQLSAGGNPQTGPFYVEGALPGDTLVVHLRRIRLNRDTAVTTAQLIGSTLDPYYNEQLKDAEFPLAFWQLDRNVGVARLANAPSEKLKNFTVPLRPMLGGIGVAPQGGAAVRTGGLGQFGGNLDYNRLVEGTTLFLPVFVPGALLFIGDGHAAQGDGELMGNALETSLDVEFSVDVLPSESPRAPRLESAEHRMAMGIGGSLQVALQEATTNMAQWLEQDYGLNRSEVASVLGTAMNYDIAEVVDGDFNVVARLDKKLLTPIPRRGAQ